MSDESRWSVHVNFTDGLDDVVSGDPEVRDGVLYVTAYGPGRASVRFEAAFPLRHVKSWWVDYEDNEDDAARMPAALGNVTRTGDSP